MRLTFCPVIKIILVPPVKKCVCYVNFTKFTVTLDALCNYHRMKNTKICFIGKRLTRINYKEDISNLSSQPSLHFARVLYIQHFER
jgi:hypothetical protein